MSGLIGEYECRLDSKSRLVLPVGLKKQLPAGTDGRLVINRGFERHLVLYPDPEWQRISAEINRLNIYVRKNRDFMRYFFRGATELQLDRQNRLLLPKPLLSYAAIEQDIVLFAYAQRIEVWSKALYEIEIASEPDDFAEMAERIMGGPIDDAPQPTMPPPFTRGH